MGCFVPRIGTGTNRAWPGHGLASLAAAMVLVILHHGPARAEDPSDVAVPHISHTTAISQVGERFQGLVLPQPMENILMLWRLRTTLAKRGKGDAEREKLQAVEELRKDLGWPGIPEVSAALSVDAARAAAKGDYARAMYLLDWAIEISPQEPGPRWTAANVALRSGSGALASFGHLWAWLELTAKNPLERGRLLGIWAVLGFPSIVLLGLVTLLVAWLRHKTKLVHDLGHRVLRESTEAQRGVLALMLLLLPLLLPFGVFGVLLGWALLVWPYARVAEKAVALASLGVIAASPVVGELLDRQLDLVSGLRAAAYRMQYSGPSTQDYRMLQEAYERSMDSPVVTFTLALYDKRSGKITSASRRLRKLLELRPHHRQGLILAGIIELIRGNTSKGKAMLEEVVERWPDSVAAHFDLYRVAQATQGPGGGSHLLAAEKLDELTSDAYLMDDHPGLNRFLMDEPLPPEDILGATELDEHPEPRFIRAAAPWLWGRIIPASLGAGVTAAGILLLGLLWGVFSKRRFAHVCVSCGQALCPTCHPLVGHTKHCEACTPGFVLVHDNHVVSPAALEQARQAAIRRRDGLATAMSALVPGSGAIYYGDTLLGASLALAWAGLWLGALSEAPRVFDGHLPWGVVAQPFAWILVTVIGVTLWALGLGASRRHVGDEWEQD